MEKQSSLKKQSSSEKQWSSVPAFQAVPDSPLIPLSCDHADSFLRTFQTGIYKELHHRQLLSEMQLTMLLSRQT